MTNPRPEARRRAAHHLTYGLAALLVALAGCSTAPKTAGPPPPEADAPPLVGYALSLRGTPYRYGGDSPRQGLDLQRLRAACVPALRDRPAARFGIDGAPAAAGPRHVPEAGGPGVLQYPRAPGLTRRDLRRPGQFRPCPEPGHGFRAGVETQAPLLARPAQRCPATRSVRLRLVLAGLVHDGRVASEIDQDKRSAG